MRIYCCTFFCFVLFLLLFVAQNFSFRTFDCCFIYNGGRFDWVFVTCNVLDRALVRRLLLVVLLLLLLLRLLKAIKT